MNFRGEARLFTFGFHFQMTKGVISKILKTLKYQFYHRLAYFYIFLFAEDKTTYSQCREDLIIDILTGFKKKGVYIDIGAGHPDHINNTRKFYERGWRGINIEPDVNCYKLFLERRPGDVNLNLAAGKGETNYYEYIGKETDFGFFSATCLEDRGKTYSTEIFKPKKIILTPLSRIFKEQNLNFVDFITIDVEGFENNVLESNDWKKNKVRILCIEGRDYDDFLKKFGYKKVLFDGTNTYYKLK